MRHLVIFPGRFQPPHPGHFLTCNWLREQFPNADIYVATSNHMEDRNRSPFSFEEKKAMFGMAGINGVHHARQPYKAKEICERYDASKTILTYSVCKKDMESEERRFGSIGMKKDGTPSYFQPWPGSDGDFRPAAEHAYIMPTPVFDFNVNVNGSARRFSSATEIRSVFPQLNESGQKTLIESLYGKYDEKIHQLFIDRLK